MTSQPQEILIIGAGVFGLSTALSLLSRPAHEDAQITILDSAAQLPNPHGSSVDASRIVRADYGNAVYARLAVEAQERGWRDRTQDGWGGQGRYHEPGFVLTVDDEETAGYLKKSMVNARAVVEQATKEVGGGEVNGESRRNGLKPIEALESREEIARATGYDNVMGRWGYVNWNSGWADAGKCVEYALRRLQKEGKGRVKIRNGARVDRLLVDGKRCAGVRLEEGEELRADLTIVAAGAWSPSLVDLRGRCLATGQVLAYIDINQEEQNQLEHRPTIINLSKGMFVIPPRGKELKVARHGFGYQNLTKLEKGKVLGADEDIQVSVPWNGVKVPKEGQEACRDALRDLLPEMADRPFSHTRVCWYCDTPDGDFLIDYHPNHEGLFIATGGSGHGFKFFPVIGEKIVDAIDGELQSDLKQSWRWREKAMLDFEACDDGSRAGARGMMLGDELAK